MFLNSDVLTNKMAELRMRVLDAKPTFIGVSEVKPKNLKALDITPLQIHEYDVILSPTFHDEKDRGTLIYVH